MTTDSPHLRGRLIVFEGIDGSGKSTQIRALAPYLRACGIEVVTDCEPTHGPWGMKVREAALAGHRLSLDEEVACLLEDRREHVRDLIEDFVQGAEYEKGAIRRYDGKFYRMAQKIDSTTSQTYLPGTGTESLYTLIDLAPDGIRVWHAPTDATNSFALGERCHYPDADGPIYVSKRDGNTSEPGTDEWWELAE